MPCPVIGVLGALLYVWLVPRIALVNGPDRPTVLPCTLVTAILVPSPRLITRPTTTAEGSFTTMLVSPMLALLFNCVVVTTPPFPTTCVICVPVGTPVTVIGLPVTGAVPVKPITYEPVAVVKLDEIVPL